MEDEAVWVCKPCEEWTCEISWIYKTGVCVKGQTDTTPLLSLLQFAHAICHAGEYTAVKKLKREITFFVLLWFYTLSVCGFGWDICINVSFVFCVSLFWSNLFMLCRGEESSWPKLKGMTVNLTQQNWKQSVLCLLCFLHSSPLSVLAASFCLSYFIPFLCTAEHSHKEEHTNMNRLAFYFCPLFPSLWLQTSLNWKTAMVHSISAV